MLADSHSRIPTHSILAALGAAALLAMAPGPAAAQPGAAPGSLSPARLSRTDETMLRELARGNLAEVAAGKLALQKAQDTEVKTFAQTMVDDHSAAMKELEQFAQSKSVKLPTQPTGAQISMMKGMESLRPGSFDKLYLTQSGVTDHRKTLALLKRMQAQGQGRRTQVNGCQDATDGRAAPAAGGKTGWQVGTGAVVHAKLRRPKALAAASLMTAELHRWMVNP